MEPGTLDEKLDNNKRNSSRYDALEKIDENGGIGMTIELQLQSLRDSIRQQQINIGSLCIKIQKLKINILKARMLIRKTMKIEILKE